MNFLLFSFSSFFFFFLNILNMDKEALVEKYGCSDSTNNEFRCARMALD